MKTSNVHLVSIQLLKLIVKLSETSNVMQTQQKNTGTLLKLWDVLQAMLLWNVL